MSDTLQIILEGLLNTTLIVVFSSVMPLILGAVLSVFSSKYPTANKIFSWLSLPFECICPLVLLYLLYFMPGIFNIRVFNGKAGMLLLVVLAFSIAFMGYMPARCVETYSFWKNTLYNGLGLISTVFKWSFCVGIVGQVDFLKSIQLLVSRTYNAIYYIIPFVFAFGVLLIIEIARRLIKQFMK